MNAVLVGLAIAAMVCSLVGGFKQDARWLGVGGLCAGLALLVPHLP